MKPCAARERAMGSPMAPRPMNPMRSIGESFVCLGWVTPGHLKRRPKTPWGRAAGRYGRSARGLLNCVWRRYRDDRLTAQDRLRPPDVRRPEPLNREAHASAPLDVRTRPRQRHADDAADRPRVSNTARSTSSTTPTRSTPTGSTAWRSKAISPASRYHIGLAEKYHKQLRRPRAAAAQDQRQDQRPERRRLRSARSPRRLKTRCASAPTRSATRSTSAARRKTVDIAQCNEVRRECERYGMPLIIWGYPRGSAVKAKGRIDSLYAVDYAARVACEIGADIVKLNEPHWDAAKRRATCPSPTTPSSSTKSKACAKS